MNIKQWPSDERPREKFLTKGADALSEAELLAILLRTGKKGKTAIAVARELLISFQGLNNLLTANIKQIIRHPGMGIVKAIQLKAAVELTKRQLHFSIQNKDVLENYEATKTYLTTRLQHRQQEIFACIFLDNRNQIICYEELFFGTVNYSTIHPREIIKRALQHNAAAVIFAHNHPSGYAAPSDADLKVTKQLITALELVDVRVLDHLIVGANAVISIMDMQCGTNT
ncbi:MAG: DNA repair protein RadC [Gammaproteobacteria bacterium]|nr:DNA repair protein RadC [Gammaproteobacteria bacterium]